jgi:hypothetical protein
MRVVRMPPPKQVRFIASAMIGIALVLVAVSFARQHGGMTPFGTELGGDYPAFYLAGRILNSAPERLHDMALQEKLYHEVIPAAPAGQFLLYPNAPFLAILFRPLALLPYAWSYLAWLVISAVMALTGFWLLCKASPALTVVQVLLPSPVSGEGQGVRASRLPPGDWLTAMLAAFSFTPFLFEGWVSGQTCAIVILCTALAIYLRQQGREFSAGMALAVLAFKPTLLLLLLPMLVVTRSFRVLLGVAASGLGLLVLSVWAVGCDGCLNFLRFLLRYAQTERVAPEILKSSWKYVDLRSAADPIFLHPSLWSSLVLALFVAAAATLLWRTWWHSSDWRLAWAAALIWTPVLSPHCAIYDTVLLIPAVFLLAPAQKSSDWFLPLVMLVYLAAWCSQPIAAMTGFQPLSAAIVLLGLYVCYTEQPAVLLRRSRRQTFL